MADVSTVVAKAEAVPIAAPVPGIVALASATAAKDVMCVVG